MRYFELKEGRSQKIDENAFTFKALGPARLAVECVKQRDVIYRGVRSGARFMYGNSLEGEKRRSANTTNEYTLLLDNLPSWAEWPKRSSSFICSGHENYASEYGTCYVVLPYGNPDIAICKDDDFWTSFPKISDHFSEYTMSGFNRRIRKLGSDFGVKIRDDSFENLTSDLKAIQDAITTMEDNKAKDSITKTWLGDKNSILENLNELLAPQVNGFKKVSLRDLGSTNIMDNEVWFSGEAVFCEVHEFRNMLKRWIMDGDI